MLYCIAVSQILKSDWSEDVESFSLTVNLTVDAVCLKGKSQAYINALIPTCYRFHSNKLHRARMADAPRQRFQKSCVIVGVVV